MKKQGHQRKNSRFFPAEKADRQYGPVPLGEKGIRGRESVDFPSVFIDSAGAEDFAVDRFIIGSGAARLILILFRHPVEDRGETAILAPAVIVERGKPREDDPDEPAEHDDEEERHEDEREQDREKDQQNGHSDRQIRMEEFHMHVLLSCFFHAARPSKPEKSVLEDAPERGHTILPVDLFSFLIISGSVGDGHLPDARMEAGDLKREFGFESEAFFTEFDLLKEIPADHFVAALHIEKREIGKNIAKIREEDVDPGVPEGHDLLAVNSHKGFACAEDDIRFPVENGLKHRWKLLGAIFEIGILDRDDVASRHLESSMERCSFSAVCFAALDLDSA